MNSEQFKALQEKINAIAEDRLDEKISPAMVNPFDKIPDDVKQRMMKNQKKRSQAGDPSRNEIPDNIQKIIDKKFKKEQIGEDEVDAQKMKALDAFSNALADMNRAFVALAKIDQAEGNSGSGDLTDQLETVDKHIENLYQVDRRMYDIIPK
jgi:hypothetical protein